MQKYLKGLYQDCDPVDQPANFYRDALNMNINAQVGAKVSEQGTTSYASIPADHTMLGHELIFDQRIVVFSVALNGTSAIGILSDGTYTQLATGSPDLSFDRNHPIQVTHRINADGEAIVYWTDGLNPPRFYNIDTDSGYTEPDELNIFPYLSSVGTVDLDEVRDYGGSITSGSCQFAFRYVDSNGNTTNFFSVTNPISIVRARQRSQGSGFFVEGNPTQGTGKSIALNLSNLDTNYDSYQIAVIRYEDGTTAPIEYIAPITITDSDANYIYTGGEDTTDGSLDEININRARYNTAGNITQADDILYLGNLKRDPQFDYQKYANNIKVRSHTKTLNGEKGEWSHGDSTIVYFNKSFRREEVYAFYIAFKLDDGSYSPAYHIPGRAVTEDDSRTVNETDDGENVVQIDDTASRFHFFSDSDSNNMGAWENLNETYPNDDRFTVIDIASDGSETQIGDLRGENVRHHRMPDYEDAPVITDTSVDGKDASIDILGVEFFNIKIPDNIRENIKGVEFFYAQKNSSNRLVFDQANGIRQTTSPDDLYNTQLVNNFVNSNDDSVDAQAISLVPFSTMYSEQPIAGVSYAKQIATNIVSDVEEFRSDSDRTGVTLFDQTPTAKSDPVTLVKQIEAIARVPSHLDEVNITQFGFSNDKKTTGEESQIIIQVPLDGTYTDADRFFNIPFDKSGVDTTYTMQINLMQLLKEVHSPFDQQILIPMGVEETDIDKFDPASPGATFGEKATTFISILEDGPTTTPTKATAQFWTPANPPGGNGNVTIQYPDGDVSEEEVVIPYLGTDSIEDLVTKVVNGINADGTIQITADPFNTNTEVGFTEKRNGAEHNGNIVRIIYPADPADVTIEMEGGKQTGDVAGNLKFTLGDDDYVQTDVLYGDTATQIAAKILTSSNNDSESPNFIGELDDEDDFVVNLEAKVAGTQWNVVTTKFETGDVDLSTGFPNFTGGTDGDTGVGTTGEVYKGDTFINKYGYRISDHRADIDSGFTALKHIFYIICESADNIAFRESGDDFFEINGNNRDFAEEFLFLENDDEFGDEVYYDNYFGYDIAHSIQSSLKSTIPQSKRVNEITNFPTRVIRSQKPDNISSIDNFRVFLDSDFLDLPRNRGPIKNLAVLQNILIIHMERGLYRTKGREELATGDFRAFLGSGDIFQVKPDELYSTEDGFAGIQDFRSGLVTQAGYLFLDSQATSVFLLGEGADEISDRGLRNFFDQELIWYIDDIPGFTHEDIPEAKIILTYDPEFKRILLTKKDYEPTQAFIDGVNGASITFDEDQHLFVTGGSPISYDNATYFVNKSFTISYLPEIQGWVSFHSYTPDYYIRDLDTFYSLNDTTFHSHNGNPLSFYGTEYDFEFEFVDNRGADQTKLLQNVEFLTYAYNLDGTINFKTTFDKIRITNELQDSGEVDLIYFTEANGNIRNVEHTWKANKFRDAIDPDTGLIDTNLPYYRKKKFTGKYAKVRLYYTPVSNRELRLIGTRVNFRLSHR